MSPLNKQLINRKAKIVEEDLARLKEFEELTLDKYLSSPNKQLAVERLLERITGRLIDINYHILKEEFNSLPKDYHNSFIELARYGVLTKDFAELLAPSAGLRNALAHEYDEIDNTQVYYSIKNCLDQVPKYLKTILTKFS